MNKTNKFVAISTCYDTCNGIENEDHRYFQSQENAINSAYSMWEHLTSREKEKSEVMVYPLEGDYDPECDDLGAYLNNPIWKNGFNIPEDFDDIFEYDGTIYKWENIMINLDWDIEVKVETKNGIANAYLLKGKERDEFLADYLAELQKYDSDFDPTDETDLSNAIGDPIDLDKYRLSDDYEYWKRGFRSKI